MLTEDLLQDARGIADRITALRRSIHSEPEIGLQTPKTLAKVRAELADLPLAPGRSAARPCHAPRQ